MGEIRAATGGLARAIFYIALFIVIATGVTVAILYWHVWFSGVSGKAGVTIKNNDSGNRIAQQNQFNTLYQQVTTDQANIQDAVKNPGAGYDLADLKSQCRKDVAAYNAEASGTLSAQWRPESMPANMNQSDYCNAS